LPDEAGINVALGPWTIMDQQGWSDVLAIDALACNELKDIDITMSQKVVDWGTNDADGHSFNYDFMHFVMHFATGTMYDRYQQMFVGTDYYWNHYGDYRNPEFVDLLGQLDITTGADQQAVADEILTIMGEDMPIIPFGGHPNWYQYSTKYWVGYSSKDGPQILPAGPFGGSGYSGLLQTAVLGLRANTDEQPVAIDMMWILIAVVVVVVVVIVILGIALSRHGDSITDQHTFDCIVFGYASRLCCYTCGHCCSSVCARPNTEKRNSAVEWLRGTPNRAQTMGYFRAVRYGFLLHV